MRRYSRRSTLRLRSAEVDVVTRATLARHSLGVRALHAINALVTIVLLVTGLALGGFLTQNMMAPLGGHVVVNVTHRLLGLAFVVAWLLLVLALPGMIDRLLHHVLYFRRNELRWPLAFLRFYLRPRRYPVPFHDGRFDPAQRVIFIGIIGAVVLMGVTGVYLYLTPQFSRLMLAYAIRIHIVAAWLLMGCLGIHIVAGSGVLRTHRGLVTAMFGSGRVDVTLAQALWPGWARRRAGIDPVDAATPRSTKEPPTTRNTTDDKSR